jgi:diguanylate cyclase (GGDEF)-like protein
MKSLQTKIFLFFISLLILVQAIAFWTVMEGNKSQEKQEINSRLTTAKTIFNVQFDSRIDYLSAFAETAAKDYGIKQVFTDDLRSLLFAMNNHRKRIDADIAMAISASGMIKGQLLVEKPTPNSGKVKVKQGTEQQTQFRFPQWLSLENKKQDHLYAIDNAVFQLSLSPLTVGDRIIGWLAFGFKIDQTLAKHFFDITQLHTDFAIKQGEKWRIIASSNTATDLSLTQRIIEKNIPNDYIAVGQSIVQEGPLELAFAMYGFRADIVKRLQEQWWQLLMLTFITLFLSLAVAYIIAASITKPIKKLVTQAKIVARGDYHQTVNISDNSELGQLAIEFNAMQSAVLTREEQITHRANHDPLTNLPNRRVLNSTVKLLAKENTAFSVYHLNLCRVKDVNETLGHDVGDWLIKSLAQRLAELSEFRLLCHVGADEFILLAELDAHYSSDNLMKQIHQVLEGNCYYQGISLQLQVRTGIASVPEHCANGLSILKMADTALNYSRKVNRPIQIYHRELNVNSVERLNLINDLKDAIAKDQLELHYQPKINLRTGIITHVEALVRWRHPQIGMIPPDNFIHIAEQTGQINPLTRWVFITALKQYRTWQAIGLDLNMAVNISAENLKDNDFYLFINQTMTDLEVPPDKVTLEVTESAVVDEAGSAIALLQKFKADGLKISIDDYGTGYSSLAQLKQLPVHELKIDKSFVQRLCHDEDDQIIVRSTIELAHNMGLSVVAEGIEDEFSLNWLTKHHCELGQGYFISRPKEAKTLTPWLLEKNLGAIVKEP